VRRQPHPNPRSFGSLAYGHRHIGAVGARARDPDADPRKNQEHDGNIDGILPPGAAKDIILAVIGEIGTGRRPGYNLEIMPART